MCEVCVCVLGYDLEKRGDPNTTPSQKHETSYLPADLWLWVQRWTWVCFCVDDGVHGKGWKCKGWNCLSSCFYLTQQALQSLWTFSTHTHTWLSIDFFFKFWLGVGKLMNDLCETRCRVVALPHFSTAGHQSHQRTTAFPCQQFCVYLLVVRRCFHLELYIQMLHSCNKCLTSACASVISTTKQFEGLGSTKFYQSRIVQMEVLRNCLCSWSSKMGSYMHVGLTFCSNKWCFFFLISIV